MCPPRRKLPRGRRDKKSKHRIVGPLPLSEDRSAQRTERCELRGGRTEQPTLQSTAHRSPRKGTQSLSQPQGCCLVSLDLNFSESFHDRNSCWRPVTGFCILIFFCIKCNVQELPETPQITSSPVPAGGRWSSGMVLFPTKKAATEGLTTHPCSPAPVGTSGNTL